MISEWFSETCSDWFLNLMFFTVLFYLLFFYSFAIIPIVLNLFHLRFPDFLSISDAFKTSGKLYFQNFDFINLFCFFGILISSCPDSYCFKSDEFNLINSEIFTKTEFVFLTYECFPFCRWFIFSDSYSYIFLWILFWIWLPGYYKIFSCAVTFIRGGPFPVPADDLHPILFLGLRKFQLIQAAYSIVIWPVLWFSCFPVILFCFFLISLLYLFCFLVTLQICDLPGWKLKS